MQENESHETIDPKRRLESLLRSNRVIRFFENIADKEYPYVTCSIYGAPKSNELFVKLSNGAKSFVEVVPSRLFAPPMEDRIFGMDVLDHDDAFRLADAIWEKHRTLLVREDGGKK